MKILFAHDHHFFQAPDGIYSGGGLPASAWERYLEYFSSVVVLGRDGGFCDSPQAKGLTLSSCAGVSFDLLPSVSRLRGLLGFSAAQTKVEELVSQADCVVARLSSEFGLMAIMAARKLKKPYAIELVECPFEALWSYGGVKAKIYAPIMAYRVRRAVRNADHVLYVTQSFLQKRYPHRAGANTVGCSNVNVDALSPDVLQRRMERISRMKPEDTVTIGLVGSLAGRLKGIHILLEALQKIRIKHPNIRLRILGGGDASPWEQEAVARGVNDIVEFSGTLAAGAAVMAWLDDVDVYVHPSLKEGLPRAVIEAMSRACPVVATSVAGTPELLEVENLVAPGDVKGLEMKLDHLLSSRECWPTMAERNFAVAEGYTKSVLTAKRSAFYAALAQECLKRKSGVE